MLFNRNIEPSCAYCLFGTAIGRGEYACVRNGIMEGSGACNSFRYEPTKRVPEQYPTIASTGASEEDFILK